MQWFFVELSLVLALFSAYFALVKHRIFLPQAGFYALNTRRILFLGFLLFILHISASFASITNHLSLNNKNLIFSLEVFEGWKKATGVYNLSLYLLIFVVFLILIYFVIKSAIFLVKRKKLVLPFLGWFLTFNFFISSIYFGFFSILLKIYKFLNWFELCLFIIATNLFIVFCTYSFFYTRRFFLKLNIETGFILAFMSGVFWLVFLV